MIARFSPPLISGIIMASARIPSSGIWKAMARNVSPERKFDGAALKTTTASTIKAPSIVTVGSRPSRSATDVRLAGDGVVVVTSDDIANGPFLLALGGEAVALTLIRMMMPVTKPKE